MHTLTLLKRECRARLAGSATLVLAALLSACGGGGGGSAGQAASPAAVAANGAGSAPAAPASPAAPSQPAAPGTSLTDVILPTPPAALPCAGTACAAGPIDAIAALPDWAGTPDADTPGYLVPSTEVITTAGEAPYPDLRALPTRVLPFQPTAFGDMSVFSVASVR